MAALSLHGRSTFLIWQVEATLRAAGAPVATLLPGPVLHADATNASLLLRLPWAPAGPPTLEVAPSRIS